jgi:hypothetical protein
MVIQYCVTHMRMLFSGHGAIYNGGSIDNGLYSTEYTITSLICAKDRLVLQFVCLGVNKGENQVFIQSKCSMISATSMLTHMIYFQYKHGSLQFLFK